MEHVVLEKVVLPLGQGGVEELDAVVGGGDLLARPDVPAADDDARLVHVEPERVRVAAVVDQRHARVDRGADHLPFVRRLLG